ncbi:MAG TPA: FAD-dependent oxidoreductase [Firmicutes bacterium]|nr:FAD-dependent oxidoreductase [Bacillota bacterium]
MRHTDVLVIGGGPAGLNAAMAAVDCGAEVTLVDSADRLGGQLVKQTHKFFGSKREHAGTRGIEIAATLAEKVGSHPRIRTMLRSEALGYYPDGVVALEQDEKWIKIKPKRLVVATGASEKFLAFPNNDLPGIYGAGAVQTLMNVYGVVPGKRVVMVGAGNIGLIVSYQLRQAGVEVAAVVEAMPQIGGYAVHASKIRRLGIPILVSHSVKEAIGREQLEKVVVWKLDQNWQGIPGTEIEFEADVLCLAVGLSPTVDLLWQAGCRMAYVPELGGHVPWYDENQRTSVETIYVAGDAAGVEEASSAMLTGRIAGLSAAMSLGLGGDGAAQLEVARKELAALRAGPAGEKIRAGLAKLRGSGVVAC